jgi:hypothetical protein
LNPIRKKSIYSPFTHPSSSIMGQSQSEQISKSNNLFTPQLQLIDK